MAEAAPFGLHSANKDCSLNPPQFAELTHTGLKASMKLIGPEPKPVVSLLIAVCEFSYVLVSTSNVASAIVTPPIGQIH